MKLNEALAAIRAPREASVVDTYFLACGFEALHLRTLLHAHLLHRSPAQKSVEVLHGIYGDLRGNIETACGTPAIGSAAVIEWSDVDPRLGMRSSGGWSSEAKIQILSSVEQRLANLAAAVEKLAARMPVAVAPPSLPLPPIGNTIRAQRSVLELELERQMASFLFHLARIGNVRVLQLPHLESSLDPKMELVAGFPYTIPFTDALAAALTAILCQTAPKKGLITDLDDTLWSGIVGEVGVDSVSWSQDQHTQIHGLYQQMLGHLASCGVLLGVCSKNELSTVQAALARRDLFVNPQSFFPVYANWGKKSSLVAQIIKTWNISADSVVFVDDNPMELEEVEREHPGITCRRFTSKDPQAVWNLLGELRDLFGKPVILEEDRLRQSSIRASTQMQAMAEDAASPEFLQSLEGAVTMDWNSEISDKRPLELINKTNQFNLNGFRIGDAEWQRTLDRDDSILVVVAYQDKFGPLGKIAVLLGSKHGSLVKVSHWVMSCRAFSRRLEHHTLESLFQQTSAEEIEFSFAPTAKNKPLQEFFEALGISVDGAGTCRLARSSFSAQCGELPHKVSYLSKVETS